MPRLAAVMSRSTLIVATGVAAAFCLSTPMSASAQAPVGPCGFFENFTGAYYNHCGNGLVQVRVVMSNPFLEDPEICVQPGLTYLGKTEDIHNAFYVHPCG